jgi:uncharacterized protein YfaS (alpha-2-macroglobulin family)
MRRTDWLFIGLGVLWVALFAVVIAGDRLPIFSRSAPEVAAAPTAAAGADAGATEVASAPAPRVEGVALAARAESAPRPAAEPAQRFEYLRYNIDVSETSPRACLTFSAPLDPAKDYSPYVVLDPAAPTALSVSGQTLCIGGIQFGQGGDIVLRAGLPALDGRTLASEERAPLEFGDRPAVVTFAGNGIILPRRDADGLAIETVNVDAVTIKVSRVNDRALVFKRITEGDANAEGQYRYYYYYGDDDPSDVGEVVWEGEMAIDAERNAPATTVFPLASALGRLEPGAYYVEVTQKREGEDFAGELASARRWILFTDLALTTYRSQDGLDIIARSLQTAQPAAGAEISLLAANNEILAEARADRFGRVHVDGQLLRGEGPLAPKLVLAYGGEGDFAALDLTDAPIDLSGEDVGGRAIGRGADVFIYLDRGIYRPGETVHASALLRDASARTISRPGAFVVYRPNGLEAGRVRFETAESAGAVFHDYELAASAARGLWTAAIELDGLGQVAAESFSVEDFVPQRVALTLSADQETPIALREIRAIEVESRFLYGAPGAGLPIEGEARVEVDPSPFEAYADYTFGRHDEQFAEQRIDLPPAVADGAGRAAMALDLGDAGADSSLPLRVRAVVGVEEPGGRVITDSITVPYHPRDLYLGLNPGFEGRSAPARAAVTFDLVALDRDGNARAAEVDWRLLRIDWDYDYWRDEETGQWHWRRIPIVTEMEDGREQIPEGGSGAIEIVALEWGDYELIVTDRATGVSASHTFFSGWGAAGEDGVEAPDRVRVTAPEEPVVIGSSAEFGILAPYAGEAEVVLATDRVLEARSISVPEGGTTVSFDVSEEWAAGAYVMVSVFTPRDPVAMPKPRRAVGVGYAKVDVSARTFEIALDAPDVVRPRQTIEVNVQTTGAVPGDDAWITLAAVDEGILQLTKFVSPDPEGWYFGKKALGVALRDDYGRLLDPNQGASAPVSVGGDQLGGEGLTVTPTRTVALFSGPVHLSPDGSAAISLDLPDFNGELRLMAVAWSPDAVGGADRPLTVRDPVPVELVLPRFLAPGDEAVATATIDNVEGAAGTYAVSLSTDELDVSDAPIRADLAEGERRDAVTRIAAAGPGVAEIALEATGPQGFSVSHSYQIQTRSPFLPVRSVSRGVMSTGQRYAPTSDLLDGLVPGTEEVTVSFSAIPLDAGALYDSLDEYPYFCTEQRTSRGMPLIYAPEIAALADRAASGRAAYIVQDTVSTLLNRQSADGAIGLWRIGDANASPWLGAFSVDFLARAKAAGYAVPDAALERAYGPLRRIAEGDITGGGGYDPYVCYFCGDSEEALRDRSRAYALYVLAREGKVDVSRLRYVHDQELRTIESPLARAQIAAALAFVDDRARSANAFEAAIDVLGYRNRGDYYQSPRRDLAGVLALAAEAGAQDVVERLAQRVGEQLPDPEDLTTQEKAFLLLAAHALLAGRDGPEIVATGAEPTTEGGARYTLTRADLERGVSFANTGGAQVWRTVAARGAPDSPPRAVAEGIAAEKQVRRLDGSEVDLGEIAQGDRLVVSITLTPREERLQPLIVADLLPAGFEIETALRPGDGAPLDWEDGGPIGWDDNAQERERIGAYAWLGQIAATKIAEARDDRFLAAIDVTMGDPVTIAYIVRAVTPGRFTAPGVVVEDMYRPDVFARSPATEVEIATRS